ncbi:hypothetical protein [Gordonia sp. NPDC058843]|uniref:hypothetical protein n=1 Tax=Gordonia sp. NPDC058843 TaxID=3346648 RepID=UPI0036C003E4
MSSIDLGPLGRITFSRNAPSSGEPETANPAQTEAAPDTGNADRPVAPPIDDPGTQDDRASNDHAQLDENGGSKRRFAVARSVSTRRVRLATATLIIVTAVAGASVLAVSNHDRVQIHDSAESVKAAVNHQVSAMLSYDHATVDKQLVDAATGLTPDFRPEYQKLIEQAVIPGAREKQVNTQVTVAGTSVVSLDANQAELLLLLNQVTSTSAEPNPSTAGSRVIVSAVKSGDRWLVDGLRPV